jgi:hypothetical protein
MVVLANKGHFVLTLFANKAARQITLADNPLTITANCLPTEVCAHAFCQRLMI